MNGKLPLIAYRTNILNPNIPIVPLIPVKAPTKGTAMEVAEKKAAHEPRIKLTLKKLAILIKLVKKRDEPIVNLLPLCIGFIIKPLNRKGIKNIALKVLPKKRLINCVLNQRSQQCITKQ